ncbi:DNA-binding protein [uncultured Defluviicoccus sp.]|uniref:DNA-binding protein n=1 Tax=metagenome TaxID=256318 RepID=A0A380TJ58_9ZZZZ|nr:DNA-binding protein [uncultured Defluviicoccus sp.]
MNRSSIAPRPLSRSEQRADLWVNWLAIVVGVVGIVFLIAVASPRQSLRLTLSLLVYSFGLMLMLICSALYNGGNHSPWRDLLRRLDHAAIFVMIAGSYTPFLLVKLKGAWSHWLLIYVWAVAGLGVAFKLIWPYRFERLSVVLYLFLGWTALVVIKPLFAAVSVTTIALLAAGGVLYSIGVMFHLWERLPYQQPIWHCFVVAGAACHYVAIFSEIALPGTFT